MRFRIGCREEALLQIKFDEDEKIFKEYNAFQYIKIRKAFQKDICRKLTNRVKTRYIKFILKYTQFIPNKLLRESKNMVNKVTSVLFFTLLLSFTYCATYVTNPVRTNTVVNLCASFPSRDQIVSSADTAQADQYRQLMKTTFSVTGNDLFKTLIDKKDPQAILTTYPNLPQEYGLFVGPFVVGYVLLMMTCFCSCCCCCCPNCCPPCSCCRQEKDKPYSRCQLIWPGIVLLLALGLILAAGAIGLSKTKDLQTTIQSVGCSISVTIDDLLNGNVTTNGKFFVGIRTLYNQIGNIKTGLSTVSTQLASITPTGAVATTAAANQILARDAIGNVPSGTNATRAPSFSYGTPFDSSTPSVTLASKLPVDLGSNSALDAGTPIFNAYMGLDGVQSALNQVTGGAQSLQTAISGGTFNSTLDQAKKAIGKVSDTIESGDKMFFQVFSQVSPHFPTMKTAITGIYAGLIGIASVGMLATLLLLICNFYKCRYLLYFTCLILVIIGVICFLLAVIISALIPIIYFGCDFATFSFSGAANFNSNFNSMLSPNLTSMVTVCLKGESGDFLQASAIGPATSSLTDLRSMLTVINSFDAVAINAQVDNFWNPAKNLILDYYTGKTLDFNSPTDQAILQRISQSTNYAGCTSPKLPMDSWVPTIQASSTVSCKITTNFAGNTQCGAAADFTAGTSNCTGCMSSYQILDTYSGSLLASLQGRYNSGDCMGFINDLINTYNNYYSIKKTNYVTTNTLISRTNAADTLVTNYKTSITAIGNTMTSIKNNLQTTVNTITDPTYGIVAGLNCAIFGEDILLVVGSICTNGFKLSFFVRLAFGIAGFGVLFSMWCASCTGVRHFRQLQANSKSKLQVKDITNETLEDIKPAGNQFAPGTLPPNQNYY